MKQTLLLKLILLPFICIYGQNAEQVAVDFYAAKFEGQNRDKIIRFDGAIKNYGEEHANTIIQLFHYCKVSDKNAQKDSLKITFQDIDRVNQKLSEQKIEFEKNSPKDLKIPENFRYKKTIRFKKLRGGFFKGLTSGLSRDKFNFGIEPSVHFGAFIYVRMTIDKNDSEYGTNFYLKLSKDLKIVDWCEESWIQ